MRRIPPPRLESKFKDFEKKSKSHDIWCCVILSIYFGGVTRCVRPRPTGLGTKGTGNSRTDRCHFPFYDTVSDRSVFRKI